MSKFSNPKKSDFIKSIPEKSIDDDNDDLAKRCKFNFSYFIVPEGKTGFEVWPQQNLVILIDKLRDYCRESLIYWTQQKVGRNKKGCILTFYGGFPRKSAFKIPLHVPHEAVWGRFRLDWSGRLCGFVVPEKYAGKTHKSGFTFDANTLYVVFIDDNHQFYQGGESK